MISFYNKSFALCLLVTFVLQMQLAAQENSSRVTIVKSEPATGELMRTDNPANMDDNGRLTAGLIIESDTPNLAFEASYGVVRIEEKPGNQWEVYLSQQERSLRILAPGCLPLDAILRDEGIFLEEGKFWKLQVSCRRNNVQLPVLFQINESNVSVFIDDEEIDYVPNQSVQLSQGTFALRIEKYGYKTIMDTIIVNNDNQFFSYEMQEMEDVNVSYRTIPGGATIFVDDLEVAGGPTPEDGVLPDIQFPGIKQVRITRSGYVTYNGQIDIEEGKDNEFVFNLQKNVGYVIVESNTPGIEFTVNDVPNSTNEYLELAPRSVPYDFVVRSKGFYPIEEKVIVNLGDTLKIDANLKMITGDLEVRISPSDADIVLKKGRKVIERFKGTRKIRDLQVGEYELTASRSNFATVERVITIKENQTDVQTLNLEQIEGYGSLSIQGIKGTNVEIKGRSSFNFRDVPAQIGSLPYGDYRLVISREGFKTVEEELTFKDEERVINLFEYYKPKRKSGAITRALIFPGVGHGFLDKKRGWLYFLSEAAVISYGVLSYLEFQNAQTEYQNALDAYNTATAGDDFNQRWLNVRESYDAQVQYRSDVELSLMVFGALKGLEILDILFTKSNKKLLKREKELYLRANANGSLSLNIEF